MRQHVQSEVVTDLEAIRELRVEIETIEAWYGPNAYSSYLRKHGRRPTPKEAAGMGRLLGGRVRADDGSMQPPLNATDRAVLRGIRSRRKAFAQRYEQVTKLRTALEALTEIHGEAVEIIGDDNLFLVDAAMVAQLDDAVCFLKRFAEYCHGLTKASGATDPELPGSDKEQDRA